MSAGDGRRRARVSPNEGGPPREAVATPACGPTDGPAVAIYLAATPGQLLEPPVPYVRIAIWQPLERLTARSWTLNQGKRVKPPFPSDRNKSQDLLNAQQNYGGGKTVL